MRPGAGVEERIEARVRRAWNGRPGGLLRIASAAYGAVAGARNLMYDSGMFACRNSPVPVVSVGGLTAGGSGKTPIAADLAHRLGSVGVRTAIRPTLGTLSCLMPREHVRARFEMVD